MEASGLGWSLWHWSRWVLPGNKSCLENFQGKMNVGRFVKVTGAHISGVERCEQIILVI